MDCSTPGSSVLHYLPELAQIHVHWVGDAIQPSPPLSPPSSPAHNLSQHQDLFQWVSSSHQVATGSFSIRPSNEYSGLISFRIDWLISLQTKGLSRVFSNTTVWKHQFFGSQPSLWSNSDTGKTITLTKQTFVGKVMSVLFYTLSTFVVAFFPPRSKHLLISWLQSPSAVILEPRK